MLILYNYNIDIVLLFKKNLYLIIITNFDLDLRIIKLLINYKK